MSEDRVVENGVERVPPDVGVGLQAVHKNHRDLAAIIGHEAKEANVVSPFVWSDQPRDGVLGDVAIAQAHLHGGGEVVGQFTGIAGEVDCAVVEGVDEAQTHRQGGFRAGRSAEFHDGRGRRVVARAGAVTAFFEDLIDVLQSHHHWHAQAIAFAGMSAVFGLAFERGNDAVKPGGGPFGHARFQLLSALENDFPILPGAFHADGVGPVAWGGAFLQGQDQTLKGLVVAREVDAAAVCR